MTTPRIVLAGGGTAGHVNPLLALAQVLGDSGAQIDVLGTAEGLEADLVPAAGLKLTTIERVPLPRSITPQWFSLPGRWRRAMAVTRSVVSGADAVVGFGGYVAAPAYLAARSASVPIVVHEQNSRPGIANRLGARYAQRIGLTFPDTNLAGGKVVGLPLRQSIADLVAARAEDKSATARRGAVELGLDPDRLTIVVTGGSLGAARLNQMVPSVAAELLATGAQVLHLSGKGKSQSVHDALGAPVEHYHVREYLVQMEHALACADLVIARAGAGTVSELAALGIPAIYVPLPIGNGEQAKNASAVVAGGGALLVADRDLSSAWLREHLVPLITDETKLQTMSAAAKAEGITDGAQRLAQMVEQVLEQ